MSANCCVMSSRCFTSTDPGTAGAVITGSVGRPDLSARDLQHGQHAFSSGPRFQQPLGKSGQDRPDLHSDPDNARRSEQVLSRSGGDRQIEVRGRAGGVNEIGHFAREFPIPNGEPQDGSSHNYADMTTSEAMRNASSYAALAIHAAFLADHRFGLDKKTV